MDRKKKPERTSPGAKPKPPPDVGQIERKKRDLALEGLKYLSGDIGALWTGPEPAKAGILKNVNLALDDLYRHLWRLRKQHGLLLDEMWSLLRLLHCADRLGDSVRMWALIRQSSNETCPEVHSLARDAAKAIADGRGPGLTEDKDLAGMLPWLGMEVLSTQNNDDSDFDCLFEPWRIDWSETLESGEIERRIRLIDVATGSGMPLPDGFSCKLAFWKAMGKWRKSHPPLSDLKIAFSELLEKHPTNAVYRWCKLRIVYETDPLNLRPASRELEAWPDYRWEKAAELAPFLEELRLAEDSAGLRLEPRSTPHRYKDYRPALENQPRVVTEHPELLEHIGPVLEKNADAGISEPRG